jgi:iron(III) transport system substrate-binding protein
MAALLTILTGAWLWAAASWGMALAAAPAWDELAAAAQQEGRVVVIGPPDPEVRRVLPAAFKARFGVALEFSGGRTSDQAARLRSERSAGLYTADLAIAGAQSMATIFHHEKMLAPLRPALVMPEVVDGTKWKKGNLWFIDPEQHYVLRLTSHVQPSFYINTGAVRIDEFRSGRELFDPKWRGKISAEDPTVPGSGVFTATRFYLAFGEEGLKRLYIDQKPVISRDPRQLTDWLLRGTYPIAIGADEDKLDQMRAEGIPVASVYGLSDLPATISAGFGMLALFDRAPHPAAAKLFANWLASKEGLELWTRARQVSPERNDIDERAYLLEAGIPQPGVSYLDSHAWDFMDTQEKVRLHMKSLLGR